ncbi:hypothetical protein HPB47_003899 [Ixodes persulcatus]|uniref:Uncharacterized protein n=1 Tax=Ixodes persulcatus TaxID=34615 RepID=A0AC60PH86_IXOPE|nr:hypothetical protein HPB47_003899 [Ixodes persulcatus]
MASTRRRVVQTEDLSNVEFETSEDVEVIPTFDAIGLREDLLRGIYAYGFEKPSAIQQRSIKPVIKGRDVIAQAQSGTGKTATFSIGVLQTIDTQMRETQALILSPTRELAGQIQKVILALGDYMNVQCHSCIGGTNLGEDIRKLDYGQHIVSGTPGRVFDMIKRRNLRTRSIKMLVLDEADEMLNKGFKEQIYDVYRYLPPCTQVVLISATLPHEILEMTSKFMTDPVRILVKRFNAAETSPKTSPDVFRTDAHLSKAAQNVSQRVRDVNGTCVCVRVERPGLTAENLDYDSFLTTSRRTQLPSTWLSHLLPWRREREKTDPYIRRGPGSSRTCGLSPASNNWLAAVGIGPCDIVLHLRVSVWTLL